MKKMRHIFVWWGCLMLTGSMLFAVEPEPDEFVLKFDSGFKNIAATDAGKPAWLSSVDYENSRNLDTQRADQRVDILLDSDHRPPRLVIDAVYYGVAQCHKSYARERG